MKTKQETQQLALQWAKEIKIKHPQANTIIINFDGSGDSGDITEIYALCDKMEVIYLDENHSDFLYDLIENHVTIDWVNNDGGGGSIEIDLNNFTMNISSFYREIIETGHEILELNLTDSYEADTERHL